MMTEFINSFIHSLQTTTVSMEAHICFFIFEKKIRIVKQTQNCEGKCQNCVIKNSIARYKLSIAR